MSERLKVVELDPKLYAQAHDEAQSSGQEAAHEELKQAEPGATEQALTADQAGPGKRVTLHFALAFSDGNEIDSNFAGRPATLHFGDGNLPAGFEACLVGMREGEEREFQLSPEAAFGRPNPDNVRSYPHYQFPADLVLEKGLMVSFSDSAGNEQAGVVLSMNKQTVEVDFNHPLAGYDLLFRVAILKVEAA